ncbi:MAG: ribosome biogenesis GTPase Der [Candidatus Aminicenantes bacterium]|nr:ribosome biogenesis GTPase Der [Candidatus Aminicenantes bacterium]
MKRLPSVAIVGFPNVGKSTLFNRLLRKKKALVHSLPGMTRDQIPSSCRLKDKDFILIDTGGFFDFVRDPISSQVKKTAWKASQEADVLLFVLDGRRGLLPAEEDLYFDMKKLNKPILIVVNKVDSPSQEDKIGDFFRLGNDQVYPVSAEHKRNLEHLEEGIFAALPDSSQEEQPDKLLKIAIIGRINVGKSSLVNRLSGQENLIVSEIPGTTRDSTDTIIRRNKKTFCLVDTAGIRRLSRTHDKREKAGVVKAKQDIHEADVLCQVMDAQRFPTRQDTAIAHLALESGKPLLLALNKWDLIEKDMKTSEACKARVYERLDFVSYAPLIFISALSGKRVVKILDLAESVHANAGKRLSTHQLNEFLSWMSENHPPLSKKKGRIKIKYMVQAGIFPPTFFLFTHSRNTLAPSYAKFFARQIQNTFDFSGTPVRIILRTN